MVFHRYHSVLLLCGLLLVLALAVPGRAQPQERCFAETDLCISGEILAFWEQNGGLPVFGLPISELRPETIEGQTLQVQWFERNRLELHPENEPPYRVLLGRLGVDVLEQQGRDWHSFAQIDEPDQADEGCRFFAETGQQVCGAILQYWQANGLDLDLDGQSGENEQESLALFGLPISPAQVETLSDGNEYTVQWFERARFELHPENLPEFRVLLGLLGNELLAAQAEPAPTSTPTPTEAAEPTPTPTEAAEPTPTEAAEPAPDNDICFFPAVPGDAPNEPVRIVGVDKVEEVATLENVSGELIDLTGWTLCSVRGNEVHQGIGGLLEPGESEDYLHTGLDKIWSNTDADDGVLYDETGKLISYWDDPTDN